MCCSLTKHERNLVFVRARLQHSRVVTVVRRVGIVVFAVRRHDEQLGTSESKCTRNLGELAVETDHDPDGSETGARNWKRRPGCVA